MIISTNNIFSIQTSKTSRESIVNIETVIAKGLYRFTLLGMQAKYASDTKDRVYAALRSSDLLNLKSDNRKIIINMSPDETDKSEGIYDLGIALSLLSCIDKKLPEQHIIAIGGLSLTGKITASRRLLQAIYTAYIHNIEYIACSTEDLRFLDPLLIKQLDNYNIRFVADQTLKGLIQKLKTIPFAQQDKLLQNKTIKKTVIESGDFKFSTLNDLNRALLIAIAGGHNILIQSPAIKFIREACEDLSQNQINNGLGFEAYSAFSEKSTDNHTKTDILYIENIKTLHKHNLISIDLGIKNSILALYTPCICGYQYAFFDPHASDRRCICSKRAVLQHKRHIESTYFDFFTMHMIYTETQTDIDENLLHMVNILRKYRFNAFCEEGKLSDKEIFLFPDNSFTHNRIQNETLEKSLDLQAKNIFEEYKYCHKILQVARTIQDCLDIEQGTAYKKPVLSKQALVLAISYIPKMDF